MICAHGNARPCLFCLRDRAVASGPQLNFSAQLEPPTERLLSDVEGREMFDTWSTRLEAMLVERATPKTGPILVALVHVARSFFGVGPTASALELLRRRTDEARRTVLRLLTARGQQLTDLEAEPPNVCGGCYAIGNEPCTGYCPDRQIQERDERERELREMYPEEYQHEEVDYGDEET